MISGLAITQPDAACIWAGGTTAVVLLPGPGRVEKWLSRFSWSCALRHRRTAVGVAIGTAVAMKGRIAKAISQLE